MTRCSSCEARQSISIRDNFVSDVDTTAGLVHVEASLWACPTCGQRFLRTTADATFFHDYDEYFFTRIDMPAGCPRCLGNDDADDAWRAITATRVGTLYQASHVGLHLDRCACGTTFAVVFTERIDWRGGEDDQTWLALPLLPDEVGRVEAATTHELKGLLEGLGRGRRFLVRHFATGGPLKTWWRDGGFGIGPHD